MEHDNCATREHFQFKISQENIKPFATVMGYLGKVGRELLIEVDEKEAADREDDFARESGNTPTLTLRALNDLKSAFTCVEFHSSFFEEIVLHASDAFSCKVAIKPICALLRQFKNVTCINISAVQTGNVEHHLIFHLFQSNGIRRVHRLQYRDCEIVHAQYEEEGASFLSSEPKVFAQLFEHVRQIPEVALTCSPDSFRVSSFYKSEALDGKRQHMNTELDINIQSFDEYIFVGTPGALADDGDENESTDLSKEKKSSHMSPVRIIFCAKEVRALVSLCEACDIDIFRLYFTLSGLPIKFTSKFNDFNVTLVLATLEQPSVA